jgi:hypothetical protein
VSGVQNDRERAEEKYGRALGLPGALLSGGGDMGGNNETETSCFWCLFGLGFIAFILYAVSSFLYSVWQFFHRPDALARSVEMLEAVGMCCGVALLLLILLAIIPSSWLRLPYEDDPD